MTSAGGAAHECLARQSNCVAPPGLDIFFALYPGLTLWATFSTRLTALFDVASNFWFLQPLRSAGRADASLSVYPPTENHFVIFQIAEHRGVCLDSSAATRWPSAAARHAGVRFRSAWLHSTCGQFLPSVRPS